MALHFITRREALEPAPLDEFEKFIQAVPDNKRGYATAICDMARRYGMDLFWCIGRLARPKEQGLEDRMFEFNTPDLVWRVYLDEHDGSVTSYPESEAKTLFDCQAVDLHGAPMNGYALYQNIPGDPSVQRHIVDVPTINPMFEFLASPRELVDRPFVHPIAMEHNGGSLVLLLIDPLWGKAWTVCACDPDVLADLYAAQDRGDWPRTPVLEMDPEFWGSQLGALPSDYWQAIEKGE